MDINEIKVKFIEKFGASDEDILTFAAPGRVNLIGEHTDYNGGFVFPAALTMRTVIVARKRNDNILRFGATDLDVVVEADLNNLEAYKNLAWGNYQLGVADELKKAGVNVCGADMLFDDTVPHGGGLSSSAAIEVAAAFALTYMSNMDGEINCIELAKIGQKAENNYVGVNCGIMDQFASAMGKKNHAIFLDCKELSYELVPIALDGYKIVISNTNKKRSLADSKYNERREECELGLSQLQKELSDKKFLGEISKAEFEAHKHLIENPTVLKRVEYVIEECDRVLRSVKALKAGDITEFGQLMNGSHDGLRDKYEVTGIELDTLVDEARKNKGVIGSRMTGAGFGGCTVSIVKNEYVDEFVQNVGKNYKEKIGYEASFYISEIGDGATII